MIAWDLVYSLLEPDFEFSSQKKLSRDFKLHRMSILHELQRAILLEATVIWLGMLVVLYVVCMLT